MNVVHFAPDFLPVIGGAQIVVHNLALHQARLGHEVTVITPWEHWRGVRGAVPYRVLPLLPRSIAAALRFGGEGRWAVGAQLALHQARHRFDVWHIHMAYNAGYVAMPALRTLGQRTLITCHGIDIQRLPEVGYGFRLDPEKDALIGETLRSADLVGAISGSIREELLSVGVPAARIVDVPNGVDVERIAAVDSEREGVRAELGWPAGRYVFLTVGRHHPKKGYDLIPEIAARVAAVRRDFLWVVVGKGTEALEAQAAALGITDVLRFVPQIGTDSAGARFEVPGPGLIRLYKAADAFAFPTLMEGHPLVMLEAMAAGLPVVTTDAEGARDVESSHAAARSLYEQPQV